MFPSLNGWTTKALWGLLQALILFGVGYMASELRELRREMQDHVQRPVHVGSVTRQEFGALSERVSTGAARDDEVLRRLERMERLLDRIEEKVNLGG